MFTACSSAVCWVVFSDKGFVYTEKLNRRQHNLVCNFQLGDFFAAKGHHA